MLCFLPVYGTTEGPLGFPRTDADARALDQLLDSLPEGDDRRLAIQAGGHGPDPPVSLRRRAGPGKITAQSRWPAARPP